MQRGSVVFEVDPDRRERIIAWAFRIGFAVLAVLILMVLLRG